MADERSGGGEVGQLGSKYVQRAADWLGVPAGNNLFVRPVSEFVSQNFGVLDRVAEAIESKDPAMISSQADALQRKIGDLGLTVLFGKAKSSENPAWLEKGNAGDWLLVVDQKATGGRSENFLKELVHEWGKWSLMKYHRFEDKSQKVGVRAADGKREIPQTHLVDAALLLTVRDREGK